jgi:hypothetical protein
MSGRDLFSDANILSARNQHKDVVRRAVNFLEDSWFTFLVNLAGSPPPALLRVMQNTGHCTIRI